MIENIIFPQSSDASRNVNRRLSCYQAIPNTAPVLVILDQTETEESSFLTGPSTSPVCLVLQRVFLPDWSFIQCPGGGEGGYLPTWPGGGVREQFLVWRGVGVNSSWSWYGESMGSGASQQFMAIGGPTPTHVDRTDMTESISFPRTTYVVSNKT